MGFGFLAWRRCPRSLAAPQRAVTVLLPRLLTWSTRPPGHVPQLVNPMGGRCDAFFHPRLSSLSSESITSSPLACLQLFIVIFMWDKEVSPSHASIGKPTAAPRRRLPTRRRSCRLLFHILLRISLSLSVCDKLTNSEALCRTLSVPIHRLRQSLDACFPLRARAGRGGLREQLRLRLG